MAISYVGKGVDTSANATSITLDFSSAGLQQGDLIVAIIEGDQYGPPPMPDNWTLEASYSPANCLSFICWSIYQSGDDTTPTFTFGAFSRQRYGNGLIFRGDINPTVPIAECNYSASSVSVTDTNAPMPAMYAIPSDCDHLVWFHAQNGSARVDSYPYNWGTGFGIATERFDFGSIAAATVNPSSTSTVERQATLASAIYRNVGWGVAINSYSPPPPEEKSLSAGIGFGASLVSAYPSWLSFKSLSAGIGFSASLTKKVTTSLSAGIGFSASQIKKVTKSLSAGIGFAANFISGLTNKSVVEITPDFRMYNEEMVAPGGVVGNLLATPGGADSVGEIENNFNPSWNSYISHSVYIKRDNGSTDNILTVGQSVNMGSVDWWNPYFGVVKNVSPWYPDDDIEFHPGDCLVIEWRRGSWSGGADYGLIRGITKEFETESVIRKEDPWTFFSWNQKYINTRLLETSSTWLTGWGDSQYAVGVAATAPIDYVAPTCSAVLSGSGSSTSDVTVGPAGTGTVIDECRFIGHDYTPSRIISEANTGGYVGGAHGEVDVACTFPPGMLHWWQVVRTYDTGRYAWATDSTYFQPAHKEYAAEDTFFEGDTIAFADQDSRGWRLQYNHLGGDARVRIDTDDTAYFPWPTQDIVSNSSFIFSWFALDKEADHEVESYHRVQPDGGDMSWIYYFSEEHYLSVKLQNNSTCSILHLIRGCGGAYAPGETSHSDWDPGDLIGIRFKWIAATKRLETWYKYGQGDWTWWHYVNVTEAVYDTEIHPILFLGHWGDATYHHMKDVKLNTGDLNVFSCDPSRAAGTAANAFMTTDNIDRWIEADYRGHWHLDNTSLPGRLTFPKLVVPEELSFSKVRVISNITLSQNFRLYVNDGNGNLVNDAFIPGNSSGFGPDADGIIELILDQDAETLEEIQPYVVVDAGANTQIWGVEAKWDALTPPDYWIPQAIIIS